MKSPYGDPGGILAKKGKTGAECYKRTKILLNYITNNIIIDKFNSL